MCSMGDCDVEMSAQAVRGHWVVESFHWHLDVTFCEDNCQVIGKQATLNLNILRKFAISILKNVEMGKFEALGAEVDWKDETQTVTARKDNIIIIMQIDNAVISVSGKEVELDVPPQLIDSRTLVPVRAVAEGLQADVKWDDNTQTVIITKKETSDIPINSDTAISGKISQSFDTVWIYNDKAYALEFNRAPEWESLPIPEDTSSFCIKNGYIYYLYASYEGLDEIPSDFSNMSNAELDETIAKLDSMNPAIYRCDLDGSNVKKLTDNVIGGFDAPLIINDSIIYVNTVKSGGNEGIYHLNLNTLENTCVVKEKYLSILFADSEFVYYRTPAYYTPTVKVFRMEFDGANKTENETYLSFAEDGNFFVYNQYLYHWGNNISQTDKNNFELSKKYELDDFERRDVLAFDGKFVYFYTFSRKLCKMDINSQNPTIIEDFSGGRYGNTYVTRLWFVDDMMYMLLFNMILDESGDGTSTSHYSIYKTPLDGGEIIFTGKEWLF